MEKSERGRVEKDNVGPDDTRHRRIKSTLSKRTIIFVTLSRGARSAEYRDVPRLQRSLLVNSEGARLFIASLRLHQSGSTMCGAAIKFRTFGGNRGTFFRLDT